MPNDVYRRVTARLIYIYTRFVTLSKRKKPLDSVRYLDTLFLDRLKKRKIVSSPRIKSHPEEESVLLFIIAR